MGHRVDRGKATLDRMPVPGEPRACLNVIHYTPEGGVVGSVYSLREVVLPHQRQRAWAELVGGLGVPHLDCLLPQEHLQVILCLQRKDRGTCLGRTEEASPGLSTDPGPSRCPTTLA